MYSVIDNRPYYVSADRHTVYPCAVSADKITVDFDHGTRAPVKLASIFTDTEIRARLGVHYEEKLDEETGDTVLVSNKTVSSIKPKTARSKHDTSKVNSKN